MDNKQFTLGYKNNQAITNIYLTPEFINSAVTLPNNPNDLNTIVFAIYEIMADDSTPFENRSNHPDIENKLTYNNVVKYRALIEDSYCENAFYLDTVYQSLDADKPGKKKMFLKYIRNIYLVVLGGFIEKNNKMSKIDIINENADNILASIMSELHIKISLSTKKIENLSVEEITSAIFAIVIHAFVDCKVLENPNS